MFSHITEILELVKNKKKSWKMFTWKNKPPELKAVKAPKQEAFFKCIGSISATKTKVLHSLQLLPGNISKLRVEGDLPLNWYWPIHFLHAAHILLPGCSPQIFLFELQPGSHSHEKHLWMTSNLSIELNPCLHRSRNVKKKTKTNQKPKKEKATTDSLNFKEWFFFFFRGK